MDAFSGPGAAGNGGHTLPFEVLDGARGPSSGSPRAVLLRGARAGPECRPPLLDGAYESEPYTASEGRPSCPEPSSLAWGRLAELDDGGARLRPELLIRVPGPGSAESSGSGKGSGSGSGHPRTSARERRMAQAQYTPSASDSGVLRAAAADLSGLVAGCRPRRHAYAMYGTAPGDAGEGPGSGGSKASGAGGPGAFGPSPRGQGFGSADVAMECDGEPGGAAAGSSQTDALVPPVALKEEPECPGAQLQTGPALSAPVRTDGSPADEDLPDASSDPTPAAGPEADGEDADGGGGGKDKSKQGANSSLVLPPPVTVQVASRKRKVETDGRRGARNRRGRKDEDGRVTRGAVGVFYPQLYLTGGDCIESGGQLMSRGRFERLAGTATAKWHVSIKVLPSGMTIGRWLQQHGLPVLQGRPRKRRAASAVVPGGMSLDGDGEDEEEEEAEAEAEAEAEGDAEEDGDDHARASLSAHASAHHAHAGSALPALEGAEAAVSALTSSPAEPVSAPVSSHFRPRKSVPGASRGPAAARSAAAAASAAEAMQASVDDLALFSRHSAGPRLGAIADDGDEALLALMLSDNNGFLEDLLASNDRLGNRQLPSGVCDGAGDGGGSGGSGGSGGGVLMGVLSTPPTPPDCTQRPPSLSVDGARTPVAMCGPMAGMCATVVTAAAAAGSMNASMTHHTELQHDRCSSDGAFAFHFAGPGGHRSSMPSNAPTAPGGLAGLVYSDLSSSSATAMRAGLDSGVSSRLCGMSISGSNGLEAGRLLMADVRDYRHQLGAAATPAGAQNASVGLSAQNCWQALTSRSGSVATVASGTGNGWGLVSSSSNHTFNWIQGSNVAASDAFDRRSSMLSGTCADMPSPVPTSQDTEMAETGGEPWGHAWGTAQAQLLMPTAPLPSRGGSTSLQALQASPLVQGALGPGASLVAPRSHVPPGHRVSEPSVREQAPAAQVQLHPRPQVTPGGSGAQRDGTSIWASRAAAVAQAAQAAQRAAQQHQHQQQQQLLAQQQQQQEHRHRQLLQLQRQQEQQQQQFAAQQQAQQQLQHGAWHAGSEGQLPRVGGVPEEQSWHVSSAPQLPTVDLRMQQGQGLLSGGLAAAPLPPGVSNWNERVSAFMQGRSKPPKY